MSGERKIKEVPNNVILPSALSEERDPFLIDLNDVPGACEDDEFVPYRPKGEGMPGTWQASNNTERRSGDRTDPYYMALAKYLVTEQMRDPKTKKMVDVPIEYAPNAHKEAVMRDPTKMQAELKKLGQQKPDRKPRAVAPIPGANRRKSDLWGGKRWTEGNSNDSECDSKVAALITWMNKP